MGSELKLEVIEDLPAFEAAIWPDLAHAEAENSLILGLAVAFQTRPVDVPMRFGRVMSGSKLDLAWFFTGTLVILSKGSPEAVDMVANDFRRLEWKLPGVVGDPACAKQFAELWQGWSSCELATYNQRIYECREVKPPEGVPGAMRLARQGEMELLVGWSEGFHRDAFHALTFDPVAAEKSIQRRIADEALFLWEADGEPVSMAGIGRPTRKCMSVGPVYTPPEHRSQGYASAVTASVSLHAMSKGYESTVLYTDLANPTSNSIYMKIGYVPVCDSLNYWFKEPAS